MRKILAVCTIILTLFGLVSCTTQKKEYSKPIQLSSKQIILIVGQEHHLIAKVEDPTAKLMWESQDDKVAKVKNGLVMATSAGKTEIAVKFKDEEAVCEVLVVDKIVSKSYDDKVSGYNITRFDSVAKAVHDGGAVAVMSGDYPEWIESKKPYKVIGLGEVKLMGAIGEEVGIDNVTFINNEPPKEKTSTISAAKKLKLNKCKLSVSTDKKAENLAGGSGIYLGKTCQSVEIVDCQISNYYRGIMLEEFSGKATIADNGVTNCNVGIFVNIRGNANMVNDFQAKGEIKGNVFNSCFNATEFLFTGASYYGELDFKDFSKYDHKSELSKQTK